MKNMKVINNQIKFFMAMHTFCIFQLSFSCFYNIYFFVRMYICLCCCCLAHGFFELIALARASLAINPGVGGDACRLSWGVNGGFNWVSLWVLAILLAIKMYFRVSRKEIKKEKNNIYCVGCLEPDQT